MAILIDFAAANNLPVKLKSYDKKWKWYKFDPATDDGEEFNVKAMRMLGALNVIDNTKPIPIGMAKAGDLIMTKWSGRMGHARIIYSVTLYLWYFLKSKKQGDFNDPKKSMAHSN